MYPGVPFIGVAVISPLQSPIQIGLIESISGKDKFGGPGCTNTVSGPGPAVGLHEFHPALHVG